MSTRKEAAFLCQINQAVSCHMHYEGEGMTFNEWIETQFNSGRIDREEFSKDLAKLREEVEVSIEFTKAVNEEFWNIL